MKALKTTSYVLVALQFCCLIFILITTPVKFTAIGLILLVLASGLLIWSVAAMSKSRLRILPDPAAKAKLVTAGPYKHIRHPMYTSLILGTLGLVLIHPTWERIATWLLLIFVLMVKLNYEEALLGRKFPEYAAYKRRSYMLFPYLI